MDPKSIRLSTGRCTNRVSYKESGTVKRDVTKSRDNASTYFPPSSHSPDHNIASMLHRTKEQMYLQKEMGHKSHRPVWQKVSESVILCGKTSLHCQNPGNILFRDHIAAAIALHFKYENDNRYNKEYSLTEIIGNLNNFQWCQMEDTNEFLSEDEIRTKIRKAFNDRKKKIYRI